MYVAAPIGGRDHCQCQITFVVAIASAASAQHSTEGIDCMQQQQQVSYDWREADLTSMSYYLNSVDWLQLLSVNLTADSLWTAFTDILKGAIAKFVPTKLITLHKY